MCVKAVSGLMGRERVISSIYVVIDLKNPKKWLPELKGDQKLAFEEAADRRLVLYAGRVFGPRNFSFPKAFLETSALLEIEPWRVCSVFPAKTALLF